MSDPNTTATPSVAAIPDFLMSLLRMGLTAGATLLTSKGVITSDQQSTVIGFGLLVAAAAWSYLSKRLAAKKLADAVAAPAGLAKPPGS